MKTEDALKMIELFLDSITNQNALMQINQATIARMLDLAKPKTRSYNRKTIERIDS